MIILIPSYEPDDRLLTLLRELDGHRVVVVDDGSGMPYADIFEQARTLGADVVQFADNGGKGAALKAGFAHIAEQHPGEDVVCADSDGQHSVVDILRVADRLETTGADVVLGSRRFTGSVPLRSRFGNAMTRRAFTLATGTRLLDTQTGLRAYPARNLLWLQGIAGDRFEYELRTLLRASAEKQHIEEVEIATIYLDENSSSHFRPLQDSLRIYLQLVMFAASSLAGFLVDAAMLWLLYSLTGHLMASVIGARLVSASVNFSLNRWWVFGQRERAPLRRSLIRYAALAALILSANVVLMHVLSGALGSLTAAKLITEIALFAGSFAVQRLIVFARPRRQRNETPSPEPQLAGVRRR